MHITATSKHRLCYIYICTPVETRVLYNIQNRVLNISLSCVKVRHSLDLRRCLSIYYVYSFHKLLYYVRAKRSI
jgi:hypothetical protein